MVELVEMGTESDVRGGTSGLEEVREVMDGSVCWLGPDPGVQEERTLELMRQLDLCLDYLEDKEQVQLVSLRTSYTDAFALDPSELGSIRLVTHAIDTGDHRPIKQPVRHSPFALQAKVDKMVQEMLEQGVIQPSQEWWGEVL